MPTAAVEVLAEWDPGTFLENLAPLPDGGWLITIPSHRRIDRVHPDGRTTVAAELAALPTGIVTDDHDAHVVAGHLGTRDWALHRITAVGTERVCDLPDLTFGNGMTRDGDRLLVADSAQGLLLAVDPARATSSVWRRHHLLAGFDDTTPGPGANGITATPQGVYVTNTGQAVLLRFGADANPDQPDITEQPDIVATNLEADDFAVHPDGTIYLATHYHHSVLALTPDGSRHEIAGFQQGVAGSTSVHVDPGHPSQLVVTTTGGMRGIQHHNGVPARLLRLLLDPRPPDASPTT